MSASQSEEGVGPAVETAPFCPVAPNGNIVGTRSLSYNARKAIHVAEQGEVISIKQHFSGETE